MQQLVDVSLGIYGAKYVESRLKQGRGISEMLLVSIFSDGDTFAPLPIGTSIDRAIKFDVGGIMSRMQMKSWLFSHIQEASADCGTVVFHDVWIDRKDQMQCPAKSNTYFSTENDVYYVIDKSSLSGDAISAAIDDVKSYAMIGAVSSYDFITSAAHPGDTLSQEVMDAIVAGVEEVIVGAYDQEGLVIWRRGR